MQINEIVTQVDKVEGWFTKEDMEFLYPYISQLPIGALLVEIGTFNGRSTFYFRLSHSNIKILTIDICSKSGLYGKFDNQNIKIPHKINNTVLGTGNIFQAIGDSHEIVKGFNWPIDFLFIDSIHTYKDTLDNLNEWGKFVRSHGLIACHDYSRASFPEVVEAVDNYLKNTPNVTRIAQGGATILLEYE